MASITKLVEVLSSEYEVDSNEIASIVNYIRENGVGIYSIEHEYNEYNVSKEKVTSLQEIRDEINESHNDGEAEENWEDYFEPFAEPAIEGFLFGETFFSVNITKE